MIDQNILDSVRFGQLLRYYREKCIDPLRGRKLTQERLGELIGDEIGDAGYTGAAVSDWERNKSQIHKDQRQVLTSLILVLFKCGGLKTIREVNTLLIAGNYRALDIEEQKQLFPNLNECQLNPPDLNDHWQMVKMLFKEIFFHSTKDVQMSISNQIEEPQRHWSQSLLALFGWLLRRWSSYQVVQGVAWIAVWLLAWRSTFPIMRWPFIDISQARQSVLIYIGGMLAIPLMIGGLTMTRGDKFWKRQDLDNSCLLRLFTHQGAMLGFQIGHVSIFLVVLFLHYLRLDPLPFIAEGLSAIWPVILGYAAARQVPFNLWRAYGDLRFGDGAIFFITIVFGPLWGFFFLIYHQMLLNPTTGILFILISVGILAVWVTWNRRRSGK